MTNFIEQRDRYQEAYITLTPEKLEALTASFDLSFLTELLDTIHKYDLSSSSYHIQIHNYLDFLSHTGFIEKLDDTHKRQVSGKISEVLSRKDINLEKCILLRYWLHVLFEHYSDSLTFEEVLQLFEKQPLKEDTPFVFMQYFRQHNKKEYYRQALLVELSNKKDENGRLYFHIMPEDLAYIEQNIELTDLLLNFLSKNNHVFIRLLDLRSGKYDTAQRSSSTFIDIATKLSSTHLTILENIIKVTLDTYYKERYTDYEEISQISDAISSRTFNYIINLLTTRNIHFYIDFLESFNKQERFIDKPIINFLTYGTTTDTVRYLVNNTHISNWMIRDIYTNISNSDIPHKDQILSIFHELKGELIMQTQQQIEQSKAEEMSRIQLQNQDIIQEIVSICDSLISGKTKYSENLLYLYELHKDVFSAEQIEHVKQQIHSIMLDQDVFNPKTARIHRNQEVEGRFTRPAYMGNNTLERCIEIGIQLDMPVENYHEKLIHYLPFTYGPDKIFNVISLLEDSEIEYLLLVYSKERDQVDNLRTFHPSTFVQVFSRYESFFPKGSEYRQKAITILVSLLEEPSTVISNYWKKLIIGLASKDLPPIFFSDLDLSDSVNQGIHNIRQYIGESNLKDYHYFNEYLTGSIKVEIKITNSEEQAKANKTETEKYELRVKSNDVVVAENPSNTDAILRKINQLHTINIKVSEPPQGKVYGVTPILEELYEFHRADETSFIDSLKEIEYPNYKDEFLGILEHSFKIEQDDNIVVSYLQKLVLQYFSNIPKGSKRDDAILYLDSKIPTDDNGQRVRSRYMSKLLEDKSEEDLQVYSLKKTISKYEEYYDPCIILTEGKTDWRHLCRASSELKDLGYLSLDFYNIFEKSIVKYNDDRSKAGLHGVFLQGGDGIILNYVKQLAGMYPHKKIIFIIDSDGKAPEEKLKAGGLTYEKAQDNIHTFKELSNLFIVSLPIPEDQDPAYQAYYTSHGACIEHYYDKEDLGGLVVVRDLNLEADTSKYMGMTIHRCTKTGYITKSTATKGIYDRNDGDKIPFFDSNGDQIINNLTTKDRFSIDILDKKIANSLGHARTRKRFSKIFDILEAIIKPT